MQTRFQSLCESVAGTLIGYVVAVAANWYVLPLFGHQVSLQDSAEIGVVFTLIAFVRGYFVRRLFNYLHRK